MIAYCRKALDAAVAASEDLHWLTQNGRLPAKVAQPPVQRLQELGRVIEPRLDELRSG